MKLHFYSVKLSGFGATPFPFTDHISSFEMVTEPDQLTNRNSILCLWGGADISPSLYGERVGPYTAADDVLSVRDEAEVLMFQRAVEMGMPILGICRGAQLACALNGGKLIQHVNRHGKDHPIRIVGSGETYITSSVHHQQMYPWDTNHRLIAYAVGVNNVHLGQQGEPLTFPPIAYREDGQLMEPEIVFFPDTNCLAIQGHPEFMQYSDPFVGYVNGLIARTFCGTQVPA